MLDRLTVRFGGGKEYRKRVVYIMICTLSADKVAKFTVLQKMVRKICEK